MTQESIFLSLTQIHTMHSHLNSYKSSINSQIHKSQVVNSNYTQLHQMNSSNKIYYY